MLDSYPYKHSMSARAHIKTPATIYNQKTVAKKSDFFVSSSTPNFSATRYWGYTFMATPTGLEPVYLA